MAAPMTNCCMRLSSRLSRHLAAKQSFTSSMCIKKLNRHSLIPLQAAILHRNSHQCRIERHLHCTSRSLHGGYEWQDPTDESQVVNIEYVDRNGRIIPVRAKVGDNAMYLAHRYNIELEGACEASLACSTCHVYVDQKYYDMIPEPQEEEDDMLDLAVHLQENSRLGSKIKTTKHVDLNPEQRDRIMRFNI